MSKTQFQPQSERLDRVSVALSGICILHCVALPILPLLAVSLPLAVGLSGGAGAGWLGLHFHTLLLFIVVPASGFALWSGYRHHRVGVILVGGVGGVALLVCAAGYAHTHLSVTADALLSSAGALVLAAVHIANLRLCRGRTSPAQYSG